MDFLQKYLDDSSRYIARHRLTPEVSLSKHGAKRSGEIHDRIRGRKRVYLDTNFWIFLRDALAGRPQVSTHVELLSTLRRGVADGRIVCPISDAFVFELVKQTDRSSRLLTATIADELSMGSSILHVRNRVYLEALHFWRTRISPETSRLDLRTLVWTSPTHSLGLCFPSGGTLPPSELHALKKAMLDLTYDMTLRDLLALGEDPSLQDDWTKLISELNEGKVKHTKPDATYDSLVLDELIGALESHARAIATALLSALAEAGHPSPDFIEEELKKADSYATGVVLYWRRENPELVKKYFPTLDVTSHAYAAVRMDRSRRFKPNDVVDFIHASASVPYYDMMLTERSLAHLLTRSPVRLNHVYGTQIYDNADDAIVALKGMYA